MDDFLVGELIPFLGGIVRFLILSPFSKRKFKSYFLEGEKNRDQNVYNWIVGLISTVGLFVLIIWIVKLTHK